MKCKETEGRIYGYRELKESERKVVDEHILQCASCMHLFLEMQQQHDLVHHASMQKPTFKNSLRFAESVMQKIVPAKQIRKPNPFIHFMELTTVRYAFAGVSMLLIVTFFLEQQTPNTSPVENYAVKTAKKEVILNTTSFLKKIRAEKSKPKSLKITSLRACVTAGDCDIPLVKNYIQKHQKL